MKNAGRPWARIESVSIFLVALAMVMGAAAPAHAQVTDSLRRLFGVGTTCPETVQHFWAADTYPRGCGETDPPPESDLPSGLANLEGVWQIELRTDEGTSQWVGALSKGLPGVGYRDPEGGWSLVGHFSTYPVTPEKVTSGLVQLPFAGGELTLRPGGEPGVMTGRWRKGDLTGRATWRKAPPAGLSDVRARSAWQNADGDTYVDEVELGDRPLRIEANHEVTCGYGHMRGNCPGVDVYVFGNNLAGPHRIWLDPGSHMELLETRFLYGDNESFPTSSAMKWIITGEPVVNAMKLHFVVWDGATPGPETLWFDDQAIPIDFIIHGYPRVRPVEISTNEGERIAEFPYLEPFAATIPAPRDDDGEGRLYRLKLWVPSEAGSGSVTSDDRDVVELLHPTFDTGSVDPDGMVLRSFLAKEPGDTELRIEWTTDAGDTHSARVAVDVSQVDLSLDEVAQYAELDVGASVP